jgi:glycosyltransferase involved in cell wall biosynthesis
MKPHISVVIPVLNEESLIQELIARVKLNISEITEEYEIIIIDDGSKDGTWEKIKNESNVENKVKGIKFSRNFGHHFAITSGIHKAQGDWVVVMDGDLQDRPEVIPELYSKAREGFDIVFVLRSQRTEAKYYLAAQRIFYIILNMLSGIDFDYRKANFSIINRKVVEAFKLFNEHSRFYGSTLKWLGFNQAEIRAVHGIRYSGKSSYSFRSRIKLAADIIFSFSERPLKYSIGIGLIISLAAVVSAIWITYSSFRWGYSIVGWASLITITLFIGGAILIMIGIVGIYIGRIFQEVKRRPLFIIGDEIN